MEKESNRKPKQYSKPTFAHVMGICFITLQVHFDFDDYLKVTKNTDGIELNLDSDIALRGLGAVRSALLRLPIVFWALLAIMITLPRILPHLAAYLLISCAFVVLWILAFPSPIVNLNRDLLSIPRTSTL